MWNSSTESDDVQTASIGEMNVVKALSPWIEPSFGIGSLVSRTKKVHSCLSQFFRRVGGWRPRRLSRRLGVCVSWFSWFKPVYWVSTKDISAWQTQKNDQAKLQFTDEYKLQDIAVLHDPKIIWHNFMGMIYSSFGQFSCSATTTSSERPLNYKMIINKVKSTFPPSSNFFLISNPIVRIASSSEWRCPLSRRFPRLCPFQPPWTNCAPLARGFCCHF